jgi:hypothetical protein
VGRSDTLRQATPETLLDIPCSQDASFTLAYSPFRAVSCFLRKTCTTTVPTYILWNAASWSHTKSQILRKGHRHCPEAHRRPQDENQNVTLLAHRESHELQEPPEMV